MIHLAFALFVAFTVATPASALTLPDTGRLYFHGSTSEMAHIRAAIAKVAGYESEAWTFPSAYTYDHTVLGPPFGMGAIDCMDALYMPNQGPYDGSEDYLGMSVQLPDGIVEIPTLEDLRGVYDEGFPGECFGYLFATTCAYYDDFWAQIACPDPVP